MPIVERLLIHAETAYVPPYFLGLAYLGLGDAEKSLAWIDKAIEENSHWVLFLRTDPAFDELRSLARFGDLIERVYIQEGLRKSEPGHASQQAGQI